MHEDGCRRLFLLLFDHTPLPCSPAPALLPARRRQTARLPTAHTTRGVTRPPRCRRCRCQRCLLPWPQWPAMHASRQSPGDGTPNAKRAGHCSPCTAGRPLSRRRHLGRLRNGSATLRAPWWTQEQWLARQLGVQRGRARAEVDGGTGGTEVRNRRGDRDKERTQGWAKGGKRATSNGGGAAGRLARKDNPSVARQWAVGEGRGGGGGTWPEFGGCWR